MTFISVKHTRAKVNYFKHTILSSSKHTNAKANEFFWNTKCIFKINTSACTIIMLMTVDTVYIYMPRTAVVFTIAYCALSSHCRIKKTPIGAKLTLLGEGGTLLRAKCQFRALKAHKKCKKDIKLNYLV